MKTRQAACNHCGGLFVAIARYGRSHAWSLSCSPECARKARAAALEARTAKRCRNCQQVKGLDAFRSKRMVCKKCSNGQVASDRRLRKGSEKECGRCGILFLAPRSCRGLNAFCGKKCADAAKVTRQEAQCLNCGETILKGTNLASGYERNFCSLACRNKYRIGANNLTWKGGVNQASGVVSVYVGRREGYASTSWAVHRVVASNCIGRQLSRGEYVIHINGENGDNSPSNLFVCESQSEYRRRRVGKTLPWPTRSNLDSYR